jgi:glutamate-1-semialdehyde 2,1-aminomutase
MILGHSHPEVVEAVKRVIERGTSFGAPTEREVALAEKICEMVPSVEKVRLVNSGTEATMSALRLARAYTGRNKVIKFDGCYHGHADSFLVQAGSGVATFGLPNTPGVPASFTEHTIGLPFNEIQAVEEAFLRYPEEIAAIICEPVTGNMGVIVPPREYLVRLLELAEQNGALLIFDEVMTGFRLAPGGAQELFSIKPHLTCLGKIVGGGLPIGAFGGRKEIMQQVAPEGPVYQAGTLSGNPVAVTAGLKTLEILQREAPYTQLDQRTAKLCESMRGAAASAGIEAQIHRCGSMFTMFFKSEPIRDFNDVKKCSTDTFADFFTSLLDGGVYVAPSQFEACFLSTAHTDEAIEHTVEVTKGALKSLGPTD